MESPVRVSHPVRKLARRCQRCGET